MNLPELKKLTETGESEFSKAELIEDIPSYVWIDSFISAAGSFYYDLKNRKPGDLDVIVRAEDDGDHNFKVVLGPDLRLKLDRILEERTGLVSTHWHSEPHGPDWKFQPLYDLVLVPRKKMEIREINEPEFAGEFYKSPSLDRCMADCNKEPDFELLWRQEGPSHVWYCSQHNNEFIQDHDSDQIISIKIINNETASRKFMDNRTPNIKDKIIAEFADEFYKEVHIFEKKKDEQIVCGVVYEPDTTDAQGDEATVEEIRKAAFDFMEKGQKFKAFHEGKPINVNVLESYLAPVDFRGANGDLVRKGSWILTTRILDKPIWMAIKSGEIAGYSMAGRARSDNRK